MVVDYVDEIRTVQPHGPYLLGGECIGGVLAYEMARRLEEIGEKVELLVLLDTELPSCKVPPFNASVMSPLKVLPEPAARKTEPGAV